MLSRKALKSVKGEPGPHSPCNVIPTLHQQEKFTVPSQRLQHNSADLLPVGDKNLKPVLLRSHGMELVTRLRD